MYLNCIHLYSMSIQAGRRTFFHHYIVLECLESVAPSLFQQDLQQQQEKGGQSNQQIQQLQMDFQPLEVNPVGSIYTVKSEICRSNAGMKVYKCL